MKLKLSLVLPQGGTHDLTLSCDITATVGDAARALIRAGASGDPRLERLALHRLAPVTLRGRPGGDARMLLLDPCAPLGSSGLQSGWVIEPVPEFGPRSDGRRLIEAAGFVEVLSGRQAGAQFSLIRGSNLIGRDPGARVHLGDVSVSRRHAVVDVSERIVVRDLDSANGLVVDGEPVTERVVAAPREVRLGAVALRIVPGPYAAAPNILGSQVSHIRAPRIDERFPRSERVLPAPPPPAVPNRIPMLAMLAPLMMGALMYLVTHSPASLMMAVFSPLIMIGSWVDGRLGGKRRLGRELARFRETLDAERRELAELCAREVDARAAEAPTSVEVGIAISERNRLLWTRRPEHRGFLEVRFGEGVLPSRTVIALPPRGDAATEHWREVRAVADAFRSVEPVPVLERLDRCGSIGIAGEAPFAEGMARSIVLQLVGLHSPAELVLVCFAGSRYETEWGWLKWLPHVDPVAGPLPVWQLAADEAGSSRLLMALEALLDRRRRAHGPRRNARSHLPADAHAGVDEAAPAEPPTLPAVLVLVLDDDLVEPARLIALAEDGPDFGIHCLWLARTIVRLPAACRTFVELGEARGKVGFVRTATSIPLLRLEHVDAPVAARLARALAPVHDAGARPLDESDLPRSAQLRELHPVDLLGGDLAVTRAWAASGSLVSAWQPGTEREPTPLTAVVGQGIDGPAVIDLRAHGPHALVGGTTGSGKSEFLQSWIMSLAAQVSPDRLTFLMIDYKGGAAFAECVDLPHTVGLVTDLTPRLVRRALTSLRAELRYREELLAQHGAKDLSAMERRSDPAAPPVLVIVIDEFSALAAEVPEFVDGVIDVAQRGRSLGLHLIMATQRPAGVIKDNLRANTNLRVALRMADESDSADVIGVKDAAFFDAEAPGRGAMKIGPGRISHFQAGYLGGRAQDGPATASVEVRSLGLAEGEAWNIPPEPVERARAKPRRDIERLRDGIIGAATGLPVPRRPWLDELPALLDLSVIARLVSESTRGDGVVFGLRDLPAEQAQCPAILDLEAVGNIAVLGAGGSGKTSALFTIAAALSEDPAPAELYAIDAAGGALDALSALPSVGAVAQLADAELTGRVLRRVAEITSERGARYAAVRAAGLAAYRRTAGGADEARIVLMIDGFAAFRQATETLGGADSPFQRLTEIMTTGRSVGVHVVLTGDRPSAVPAVLSSTLQQRLVLRLANPHDYASLGVDGNPLDGAPPGRALLATTGEEMQIGLVAGRRELLGQAEGIDALASELRERGDRVVPRVRNAPELVPLAELPASTAGRPVYGIDTQTFEPVGLPTRGLGVIAGPSGSGQSAAALTCAAAVGRWSAERGAGLDAVLLTFISDGLLEAGTWERVGAGEDEVRDLAGALARSLTRTPGGRASGREHPDAPGAGHSESLVFPRPGAFGVVVVERPAAAEGTAALPELVALAKAARRADALVLFEFEQGRGSAFWDLLGALRQPNWGLSLQPDEGETQTPFREILGRVRRADFPPGRGFSVEGGRAAPVQVATCSGLDGGRAPMLKGGPR